MLYKKSLNMSLSLSHSAASLEESMQTVSAALPQMSILYLNLFFCKLLYTSHQKIWIHSSQIPRRLKTHYHQSGKRPPSTSMFSFSFFSYDLEENCLDYLSWCLFDCGTNVLILTDSTCLGTAKKIMNKLYVLLHKMLLCWRDLLQHKM